MSRRATCPCGRQWYISGEQRYVMCRPCRRDGVKAVETHRRLRLPTLAEWCELATDTEVMAGRAAWERGIHTPLTTALLDEHRVRWLA